MKIMIKFKGTGNSHLIENISLVTCDGDNIKIRYSDVDMTPLEIPLETIKCFAIDE